MVHFLELTKELDALVVKTREMDVTMLVACEQIVLILAQGHASDVVRELLKLIGCLMCLIDHPDDAIVHFVDLVVCQDDVFGVDCQK